jgi:hypothetical protein
VAKKDLYELFESYLEGNSTTTDFANFDLSTRSTLSTMRELEKTHPNILIGTLKSIYESFVTNECELRKMVSTFDIYDGEDLMNELRTYLTETIYSKTAPVEIQQIYLKLILLLSNQRDSGKEYLIVYNVIAQNGSKFNLDPDLPQYKVIGSKDQGDKSKEQLLKVSSEGSLLDHAFK